MGVVVEARRIGLGERVAIKVLHTHYCDHPEAVARFALEARAAVRIRGEHSARVLDVGTSEGGLPFIVMELLEGGDLASVIRMGGVTMQEAVLYILQACEGMAEVHANGIIHRDLKPGNLFLTRRTDGTPLVKVLDFGVAKSAFPTEEGPQQNLTMTLVALGTPLYMSPEQVRSSRHVDARTDIWSLGAILYELIGGRPAFGGNTVANITAQVLEADPIPLTSLRQDVPPDLDMVVRKALSKRPEHRWVDVAAFAAGLAPFAGDVGRAHAERAARILRGEGRGAGAAPFTSPGMTVDMEPTAGGFEDGEDTVIRFSARHRARERMMYGVLLGLAIAAMVIGWSVFSTYREQSAAAVPLQTASKGIASDSAVRTTIAVTVARLAASAAAAPSASASAPPEKPSGGRGSRGRVGRAPASEGPPPAPPPPREEVDPLSTRR
jgi:serine/threonine-protein kinase